MKTNHQIVTKTSNLEQYADKTFPIGTDVEFVESEIQTEEYARGLTFHKYKFPDDTIRVLEITKNL
jgi:hypothetical protein